MSIIKKFYLNGVEFSNPDSLKDYRPEQPKGSSRLWRYMNFSKFVSFLDTSALFLSRADLLGDPHEGALSQLTKRRFSEWQKQTGKPQADMQVSRVMEWVRKSVFINCWHELEAESFSMWHQYSGTDGLAIVTNVDSLVESLGCFSEDEEKQIRIGRVQYVDYGTELVPELDGMPYFHKRKPFASERELRIAKFVDFPTMDGGYIDVANSIDKAGIHLPVDMNTLIHRIVISPLAASWLISLVRSIAEKYELTVDVSASAMSSSPSWGAKQT